MLSVKKINIYGSMSNRQHIECKTRLLFAKIAMAIWCQVSGVRFQDT